MLEIIPMTEEHLEGVLHVDKACFSIPWSKKDFLRELHENKLAIYRVALLDGEVVGYGGLWHVVTEGQITNIAVMPQHRRKGIADAFMQEFIKIAEEKEMIGITLEVRVSNIPAQKLYEKYGFAAEGMRKEYYPDTKEDAIIMWKYFPIYEGYDSRFN